MCARVCMCVHVLAHGVHVLCVCVGVCGCSVLCFCIVVVLIAGVGCMLYGVVV